MVTIIVENATKTFKSGTIGLQTANISFESGKIYGIVGRNGSGKTVLLKCICGLLTLSKGKISVFGKKIGLDIDFVERTGIIIENPGFIESQSGYKNLLLLSSVKKVITKEAIQDIMRNYDLDPNNKKPVGKYSLGMKQRLGIVQAIMENPDILILDEPFNNLDERGVNLFRETLVKLKSEGKTILLSTHNKTDIEVLCDKILLMEQGNLTCLKTVQ